MTVRHAGGGRPCLAPFRWATRPRPTGCCPPRRWTAPPAGPSGSTSHIPFCAVRCGYCDFNTYTATELGGGASQDAYAGTAVRGGGLRRRVLAASGLPARPLSTVFFGGGTPTLLPAGGPGPDPRRPPIGAWGLAPGAEVTTEANPDSVTPESLQLLADAGFTRVSFGMQSAVPHVLKVLDRTHTPSRVPAGGAVGPGRGPRRQPRPDLRHAGGVAGGLALLASRRHLSYAPDHISAYALIVEDGTKLAAQIRRGEVPEIDDDDHAAKYELADELISAAGLRLVRGQQLGPTPEQACRHNLAYWRGDDWWGIGPGAHSPRRRRPLVERQAPHRLRQPAGRRAVACRRPGDPRFADPQRGARHAGGPPELRAGHPQPGRTG